MGRQVEGRAAGVEPGPRQNLCSEGWDTEAEPACLTLPPDGGGRGCFLLYHPGTGGQDSEGQGLGTSEMKGASPGKTHPGPG